ncbi:MAG: tetratricopeptide repeat protein [Pseudomonadota bacterium]
MIVRLLSILALVTSIMHARPVFPEDMVETAVSNMHHTIKNTNSLRSLIRNNSVIEGSDTENTTVDNTNFARIKTATRDLPVVGYVPLDKIPITNSIIHGETTAEKYFRRALQLQATEPQIAANLLEKVLSQEPNNTKARLLLGRLLTMSRDASKAVLVLKPLLLQENYNWQPWFWAGTALLQIRELSGAARLLDQALARNRSVPAIWVQRAIVEQENGSAESALQLLHAASKISPHNTSVLLNMAISTNKVDHLSHLSEGYYKKYVKMKLRCMHQC